VLKSGDLGSIVPRFTSKRTGSKNPVRDFYYRNLDVRAV
jgi:hypothetical protein